MPGFDEEIVRRRAQVRAQATVGKPAPIVVDAHGAARAEALLADLLVLAANVGRRADPAGLRADLDVRLVELYGILGLAVPGR